MSSAPSSTAQQRAEPVRSAWIGESCIELLPRTAYEAAYTAGQPVIGFAFDCQTGTHAFAGSRRQAFRTPPNSLAFVPAGCDVYSQSAKGGEYLTITIRAEPGEAAASRRFNDLIDSTAIDAAQALRRLLLAPGRPDTLSLERHTLTLADCALRALGGDLEPRLASRWLTPQRLRRIDALIEAGLDGPLTVQDLAGALHLSAGFLSRAFRAATGKPPHAYVIDRRIARARDMLLAAAPGDLSTIALACGFTSHAHMTAAFRARLGVTPSDLRRAAG